MALKSPERELQEFLSTLPKWLQKYLEGESWTDEEGRQIGPDLWSQVEKATTRYEQLIRGIPSKFRKYRKRQEALVRKFVLAGKPGRPPKIEEANTALALEREGKSRREIAAVLGDKDPKHGKDRVRKKLKKYGATGNNPL